MKSQSNRRTIAALGTRFGKVKSYSSSVFRLGSRASRSRRSKARCWRAVASRPIRVRRASKGELPLRAASSRTSRYAPAMTGSFNSARSRSSCELGLGSSLRRVMRILRGRLEKTVVNSRVDGVEFDLFDELAPFRVWQGRRGELSPAPLGQHQVLHVGGVVG